MAFPPGYNAATPKAARLRPPTIQARVGKQDLPGKVKYSCSECQIFYYMDEGSKAHCPLCEQMTVNRQIRDQLFQAINEKNGLENQLEQYKSQVDNLTAMRTALDAISSEDLTFVKSVLYRWQTDKQRVVLKPLHGKARGRRRAAIIGFVAIFRDSDPEEHTCNSVGGMALAGYLDEAYVTVGQLKAMETIARAVYMHLQARDEQ